MSKPYLYFVILFGVSSATKTSFSQGLISDTNRFIQNSIVQLYIDSVKEDIHLYNGTEFTAAYRSSAGHPFFEYDEPQKGGIFFNGVYYPGVDLFFDLVRDDVIFVTPGKNLNVKLSAHKINWFTIQGHLFIRIIDDSGAMNSPPAGFYELAYKGIDSLVIKRKKYLYQSSREDTPSKFIESTDYYVKKDNFYHAVDSKRSLLAVYRDRKGEIVKFMQKEKLDYKKDPVHTAVRVIEYYNQLKN